jgi:beta-lactamase regulating signal transducer with metallopeptidase domain
MGPWFQWTDPCLSALCHSTWQASVLIGLVLLTQFLLGKKLSCSWRYALWWVVLLRLALPFTLESRFSLFNLSLFKPLGAVKESANSGMIPWQLGPIEKSSSAAGNLAIKKEPTPQTTKNIIIGWLPHVWLLGAVLLVVRFLFQNAWFASRLKQHKAINEPAILNLLEACRQTMGVPHRLVLLETPVVKSPALYGLFRPTLLLPQNLTSTFSVQELRAVLLHELAHVKRCDMAVNWLMTLLQILHWFNPLIWLAFGRVRAAREEACDALVLSRMEQGNSTVYGHAIIKLLEGFARPSSSPSLLGILEDKTNLEHRIQMIASYRPVGPWAGWAIAALLMLGFVGLTDANPRTPPSNQTVAAMLRQNEVLAIPHDVQLTGTVIDASSSHPIEAFEVEVRFSRDLGTGAKLITLRKTNGLVITNEMPNGGSFSGVRADFVKKTHGFNGQFQLHIETCTSYQVEIRAPGYQTFQTAGLSVTQSAQHLEFALMQTALQPKPK